jgi:adenylate kinase
MNVVLFGPPGAGKGTLTSMLTSKYGFKQVAIGDILREGSKEPTALGRMVKKSMDQGQLVQDEVVDALIRAKLRQQDYKQAVIFDGFPRTEYQAKFLDDLLNESGRTLNAAIYLDVSDEEISRRVPGRIICQECHTPFHETYKPFTFCHNCGSTASYRREDDKPGIFDIRLKNFHRLVVPVIEYYHKAGLLTIVDGEGEVGTVYKRLLEVIEEVRQNTLRPATREEVARIQALADVSETLPQEQATYSLDIVFLGSPGSGKGTQAEKLGKMFNLSHISTGDLFRANFKDNTELGRLAKSYIEKGELVPDDVTQEMVRDRLAQADVREGFILDGFPRNIGQANALTDMMTQMRRRLSGVLFLSVPDEAIVERLSGRLTCQVCQTSYHTLYNPPKKEGICDKCGGQLFRRDDDEPETIRARLRTYYGQTAPLIAYYRALGLLYEINGAGEVSDIFDRVVAAVEAIEAKDRAALPAT